MKITTNFSSATTRMVPYLIGGLLLLSAIAVIVAISLYLSAHEIFGEVPVLEERLAGYRGREVVKANESLPNEKLVELRARVQRLNELTSLTGQTLPQLFSHLEELMPDGVWLITLHYRSRENEARLVAEANRTGLLTDFMEKLERSGYFSQVLLTRQTQRSDDMQRAIQFEIQLRGKQ